ncbi:hypothetical protein MTO96_004856 [Rhipicephalus appendiculatus]
MFCISPTAAICGRIAYTSATRRQSFSTSLSSRATMWISWMTLKAGKVRLPILKKSAERTTHGVVWTIPKRDLHNLDQQEREYEAANVTVKLPSGDKVDCRTYFYLASRPGKKNMPSLLYKAVIVAGAIEHKLP